MGRRTWRSMRPLRYHRAFDIPFPVKLVWPLISDTDRMNRALGLPAVSYTPTEDASGLPCMRAHASYRGLPLEWLEYPFQWREGRSYSVRRVFIGGPVAEVEGGCSIEETAGGCSVHVNFEAVPRNLLGVAAVRLLMGPQAVNGVREQCARIRATLSGPDHDPFTRKTEQIEYNISRLEPRLRLLEQDGFPRAHVALLGDLIMRGHDEDVMRMRPFALADRWRLDRRQVLRMFLHASASGILELSWNVLCPNCRVSKDEFNSLRRLRTEAHCDYCRIDFNVDFDRLVELRFNVRQNIRKAEATQYCMGGPQNTPHIVAQKRLEPGQEVEWELAPGNGALRLRVHENRTFGRIFRDVGHEAEGQFVLREAAVDPRGFTVTDQAASVTVRSALPNTVTVSIEREMWPTDACSAAYASTFSEFRRLFASEVLSPDLQVAISNIAVLFSDLKGSTRLYQTVGDAPAFSVVREHFEMLESIVDKHNGTFVKTMGDAIMAVFLGGREAVLAALDMQRSVQAWHHPQVPNPTEFVKIGLHQGPVISVTFNDRLDYFGGTVNMAARVQAQSLGGDIVLSEAMSGDEEVAAILRECRGQVEAFTAHLPGIAEDIPLWRLTPHGAAFVSTARAQAEDG